MLFTFEQVNAAKICYFLATTSDENFCLHYRTFVRIMLFEVMIMDQRAFNGKLLADPKVLKLRPLLIFAKIADETGNIHNCLIHQHGLNFLYQATGGTHVALYGHTNQRKQFVVTHFTVVASSASVAS